MVAPMKPVKLSELIEALEFDFEEIRAFVDLENGCVVMVQRSVLSDVEEGDEEALSDVPDWQKDEVEIPRAIVADSGQRFGFAARQVRVSRIPPDGAVH